MEYEYITREYKGEKVYARDLRKMSRSGWEVVHAETIPVRRGCLATTFWVLLSIVTLGIWPLLVWLLRGRRVKVVVQYRRPKGGEQEEVRVRAQAQNVVPQKSKKARKSNKVLWVVGGGILLVSLCIGVSLGSHESQTTTVTSTPTLAATSTSLPATSTPTRQPKSTSTPVATMPTLRWGVISGIAPADVTVNLENRGFSCTSVEEGAAGGYYRSCKAVIGNADFRVDVYGDRPLEVGMIEVNVTSADGNALSPAVISPVLEFVSTIPFIDHPDLQNEAKQWVRVHLQSLNSSKQPQSGKIGQVYIELVGNPPLAYSLSLSAKR